MACKASLHAQPEFADIRFETHISSSPRHYGASEFTFPWRFDSLAKNILAPIRFMDIDVLSLLLKLYAHLT